jgi:Fe2+ transport system protein B
MVVLALLVAVVWFGAAHARAAAQSTSKTAAQDQLTVLKPAFNAYGLENSGYVGMAPAALARDYGVKLHGKIAGTLTITATSATSFCAQVEDGGWYVAQKGPAAELVSAKQSIC